ncbi:uncharacterized protein LY89DRAFT_634620 [Mollisia scopiformis]|uniref:Tat pathway signal sequence n=1 Tax=Mollisia scopiformis TaxID=149040 RepID=A0A194XXH2_MOLSC|nr:uncharacterized protein LY89DRAFT_634620 [Mollisia scopiformis]KUJ24497.1 hypothetical protein LY89DRAFT_634620 [Mollisia scopiformis]
MGFDILKGYTKLPRYIDADDSEEKLSVTTEVEIASARCTLKVFIFLTVANVLLFAISIYNFEIRSCKISSAHEASHSGSNPAHDSTPYSTFLDTVDLNLQPHTFNGRLRDNTSIYRMPPSSEVDEAWDYISTEGLEVMTVSSSDILHSFKDPSISVQAPQSWNRGPDAYIVQIDVFHQIHCLNELRKEIYHDYYYPDQQPDELHREHKNHCIHMILQNLMCHADLEIITHNWVHNDLIPEPKTRPFPDFNVVKQCRDFDGILDWATQNAVKNLPGKWNDLRIPPGTRVVPGDGYA